MNSNEQKAQVTLTHLSLRKAAKALGVNVYQVQMLLAEGVLERVKVIDATGCEHKAVSALSVDAEVARRKKERAAKAA